MAVPPVTTDMLVVFGLVGVVMVLFVTEVVSPDVTAIGVVVVLVLLGDWTQVDSTEALSGFASPATLTILAMYILSAGVQETGAVRRLGHQVSRVVRGSGRRLLFATVGITGPLAGAINNTPVVAMFIPMVTDLADETKTSPSKLLIPLSYAAMLGGTLTLVGTATNIVASDVSDRLLDHPISMFEFTPLGVVVLLVGSAYLLTVGQWLLPERIHVTDLTGEFGLEGYLSRVYVRSASPMVGKTVQQAFAEVSDEVTALQVVRGEETFVAPGSDMEIRAGDVLTIRADDAARDTFVEENALRRLPKAPVTEDELDLRNGSGTIAEVAVAPDSPLAGQTVASAGLHDRFDAVVLAARKGDELVHDHLADLTLTPGTGLLLHLTEQSLAHLDETGEVVVTERATRHVQETEVEEDSASQALAVGIVAAVIAVAATTSVPIVISALGGVVAMTTTGIIRPGDAYDAVGWEVVFLLAGVVPLGIAIQQTGGAEFLAGLVVSQADVLPAVVVLGLFYLLTGLLANLITPIASVVLLLPVAIDAAGRIGSEPFSFVLAVTFAASTAFMTPVGYQTNLMVYSPGGYRFTDYVRVGAPLQLLLAVVTTGTIAVLWGV